MTALQALSAAGGTVRITVFRGFQKLPQYDILANVIVSCAIIDPSELVPINIFTVKGTLKKFLKGGKDKLSLDMMNSRDPQYPNFWFGTGFSDYISAYTIQKIVDLIPEDADATFSRFIEFRVLENGTIQNVDIHNAYKKRKLTNAENLVKILNESQYTEEVAGEQVDIDSIIGVTEKDSIIVD
jgi:hypothetical protein